MNMKLSHYPFIFFRINSKLKEFLGSVKFLFLFFFKFGTGVSKLIP